MMIDNFVFTENDKELIFRKFKEELIEAIKGVRSGVNQGWKIEQS